jgi:hypothetical protein
MRHSLALSEQCAGDSRQLDTRSTVHWIASLGAIRRTLETRYSIFGVQTTTELMCAVPWRTTNCPYALYPGIQNNMGDLQKLFEYKRAIPLKYNKKKLQIDLSAIGPIHITVVSCK